jgi:phospholipid/cholesterol/gamma-HCH transport system substrate-binding protein
MPRTRSLAWSELKIGALALLALVITTGVIFMVGNQGGFFWQRYRLRTSFPHVQGLKEGAVVRVAGIEVGTVRSIRFAPTGADVEIEMEVARSVQPRVTTDSRAEIGSLSLLGEPLVDITAATTGTPIPEDGVIRAAPAAAQLRDVTTRASATLQHANDVFAGIKEGKGTVGRLVTDESLYRDIQTLVNSVNNVAREMTRGRGTFGRLVQDPAVYESIQASFKQLDTVLDGIAAGEGSLGRLLKDEAFAKSLTSATGHFDVIAARLSRGEGTAGKLLTEDVLYTRINELTRRLNDVSARLEKGDGTLGQLLHDRQLYENMNQTVTELRSLVSDIRKDPRKYLNVRVSIF